MKIRLTVERLEGGRVFLRDEKGRLIVWPRDLVPADTQEKEIINLAINGENTATSSDNDLPKKILNEILNSA